jgi:putative membrane protein
MIFPLLLGIILGAVTVLFALQNVALITVTFLTWQISAPLAFVLLTTLASGIIVTLLMLIPSLVRDDIYMRALKKQKREVEDDFAAYRTAHPEVIVTPAPTKVVVEKTLHM